MRAKPNALLAALTIAMFAACAPARGSSKTPRVAKPHRSTLLRSDSLPPVARAVLAHRMEEHSYLMTDLFWSVVFLEHEDTLETAHEIAAQPAIARPAKGAGADDLASMLPKEFFDLQDDLRSRATELGEAATVGDDAEIAKSWGQLSETCVACHTVFLPRGK